MNGEGAVGDPSRQPVPGVYSADQGAADKAAADRRREVPGTSVQVEALHDRIAVLEQRNGALDANAEAAKQRLARLHRDHDRLLDQLTALEHRLASEVRAHREESERVQSLLAERQRWWQNDPEAALGALGITRGQVELGQAVELLGHVYVRRDLLVAHVQDDLANAMPQPFASGDQEVAGELLEARGGVFVPIPEGHMLSVTVTPYAAD